MPEQRYVFYDAHTHDVSLEDIRAAIGWHLSYVRASVLPEPEDVGMYLVYLESDADEEFSADIWRDKGEDIEKEIAMILEHHASDTSKRFNGMLSIVYNNDDNNVNNIREAIDRCLKTLVSGALYYPESGELIE